MWNKIWFPLLLCLLGTQLSAQTGYRVEVNVKGFSADQALLAYYYGDKQYIKDTVTAVNGKFTFEGEEPLDGGIYLVVLPPDNRYFEILIDKDQEFSLATDTVDLPGKMKVSGSKDNEIFYEDLRFLAGKRKEMNTLNESFAQLDPESAEAKALKSQITAIDASVKAHRLNLVKQYPDMLYSKVIQALREPEIPAEVQENGQEAAFFWYRNHYFDGFDFQDERLLRTPVMWNKIDSYLEKLTYKVPDSLIKSADFMIERARGNDDVFQFMVIQLLNKYAQSKIMGMDAVYVHLVEKYYMSGDAFWADEEQVNKMAERALAISPTIIGRKAPDIRVQDVNGRWTNLHGVKGRYTILYFWDYDCGHCKTVTPQLAKIYPDFIEHDVKLFAVSIDGDVEVWKKKVEEYGLAPAINVQDHQRQSGMNSFYDLRSTPRIFILDADKKIIAKQISVDQVREILNHELGLDPDPSTTVAEEGD